MKEARGTRIAISRLRKTRGFSLGEIMVVICIIGILASAAIMAIPRALDSSKVAVARNLVETLNSGVHRFNQANYEMLVTAVPAASTDELAVLRTLQYRNPTAPVTGSPYVRNDWNPVSSSSTADYRIVWAGSMFQLVQPGAAGTGLKVKFDGSDLGTPYTFPAGFAMAGQ
jgi:prepilin-type N-terminal cleavage/methylation domain-containing protein